MYSVSSYLVRGIVIRKEGRFIKRKVVCKIDK
jgi:hypothetical protein